MLRIVKMFLGCLIIGFFSGCDAGQQMNDTSSSSANVQIAGAMRNVMHRGELAGIIALDTIADRNGLYGLGPLEYLRGELLILDGEVFVSTVEGDSSMRVRKNAAAKAPFFVYGHQTKWETISLPDSIRKLVQLENYMNVLAGAIPQAFVFKLSGPVKLADIHIQNLPEGTSVSSPQEAHQGQVNYLLRDQQVDIVGFYSTQHKGIFTHHDSNMHLHLISADRQQMGHLDEAEFKAGEMTIYLPAE